MKKKGGEMMNDLRMEQRQEDQVEKLSTETYTPPQILIFGDVITLARGSGSGDSDGCSSGHYDE
jgi:hypothetical protein